MELNSQRLVNRPLHAHISSSTFPVCPIRPSLCYGFGCSDGHVVYREFQDWHQNGWATQRRHFNVYCFYYIYGNLWRKVGFGMDDKSPHTANSRALRAATTLQWRPVFTSSTLKCLFMAMLGCVDIKRAERSNVARANGEMIYQVGFQFTLDNMILNLKL